MILPVRRQSLVGSSSKISPLLIVFLFMKKIDFKKEQIPFTQVANQLLFNKKISLGAKAIYAYMYAKPAGWHFSSDRMGEELGVSPNTVLKHIKELIEHGYMTKEKLASGRMLYTIYPEPNLKKCDVAQNPNLKKARQQKSQTANFGGIINKEIKQIKSNTNKDTAEQSSADTLVNKQIAEVIDAFKDVNPSYKKWFANKTQREASKRLIESHSYPKVIQVIKILNKTNTEPFLPQISTPLQLEDKWASLANGITRLNKEKEKTVSQVAF